MRALVLILTAGALAACAGPGAQQAPEVAAEGPPARWREIVAEHLRANLFDPWSARDVAVAPPRRGQVYVDGTLGQHESGWVVCYRANAKNRMGGYVGLQVSALAIRGDRVVASTGPAEPWHYDIRTNCADARYEPLPEFERLVAAGRKTS